MGINIGSFLGVSLIQGEGRVDPLSAKEGPMKELVS